MCVSVCVWVAGCLRKSEAQTIGNQIEADFTLCLLALACDNRLARKADVKEEKKRSDEEQRDELHTFGCCAGCRNVALSPYMYGGRCVCVCD